MLSIPKHRKTWTKIGAPSHPLWRKGPVLVYSIPDKRRGRMLLGALQIARRQWPAVALEQ